MSRSFYTLPTNFNLPIPPQAPDSTLDEINHQLNHPTSTPSSRALGLKRLAIYSHRRQLIDLMSRINHHLPDFLIDQPLSITRGRGSYTKADLVEDLLDFIEDCPQFFRKHKDLDHVDWLRPSDGGFATALFQYVHLFPKFEGAESACGILGGWLLGISAYDCLPSYYELGLSGPDGLGQ